MTAPPRVADSRPIRRRGPSFAHARPPRSPRLEAGEGSHVKRAVWQELSKVR
jgi:hypothetical protein